MKIVMMTSKKVPKCRVCAERITAKLPYCDYTPLDIRLPTDVLLCFWCRRDLMGYYGTIDIDENQVTQWLSYKLIVIARRIAQKLPLHRCDVGDGHGRCWSYAMQQRDKLWVCTRHANQQFVPVPRHYLDWRSQRTRIVMNPDIVILPPLSRVSHKKKLTPVENSNKGSANGNSRLTEADVHEIRQMINQGMFNTTIARRFNVTHSLISAIRRNKIWTHTV